MTVKNVPCDMRNLYINLASKCDVFVFLPFGVDVITVQLT